MSQDASTSCRRTAVLTKAIVASSASARRRGPAGTCFGSLKTWIGAELKTSCRLPVFGYAITRAAAAAARPSASAIQRSRRRKRGEASGFRRPAATELPGDVAGQPLLQRLALLDLRADEVVCLAQVLACDRREDELPGDAARGRVELDRLRDLAHVDDRLVREDLLRLAAVRREHDEHRDQ